MWLTFLLAAAFWLLIPSQPADSAEQKCDELGTNCVCSEPLNTTQYGGSGAGWYNPADSTTKECTYEDANLPVTIGDAIRSEMGVTGSNNSVALSRLPASHTMQYFGKSADNFTGLVDIQHMQKRAVSRAWLDANTPGVLQADNYRSGYVSKARAAARVYMYFSDGTEGGGSLPYSWAGGNGGACTNGKIGAADTQVLTWNYEPNTPVSTYNFDWGSESACAPRGLPSGCSNFKLDGVGGTQYAQGCCGVGPTISDSGPTAAEKRGKWWYLEWAISNRFTSGWRLEMWVRNVTDNLTERKVLDTTGTIPSAYWTPSPNLTPAEINATGNFLAQFGTAVYRASTCTGWIGESHFLFAQWDTNANQRINKAYEVEGGGTPGLAPNPATNLRWLVTGFVLFASSVGMVLGAMALRRRYVERDTLGGSDTWEQPVEPRPVDGAPREGQREGNPVVESSPANELVGAAREIEK